MNKGKITADIKKDTKESEPFMDKENIAKAYEQAEADIEEDTDLNNQPEQGDDLDEGELAKLEGED